MFYSHLRCPSNAQLTNAFIILTILRIIYYIAYTYDIRIQFLLYTRNLWQMVNWILIFRSFTTCKLLIRSQEADWVELSYDSLQTQIVHVNFARENLSTKYNEQIRWLGRINFKGRTSYRFHFHKKKFDWNSFRGKKIWSGNIINSIHVSEKSEQLQSVRSAMCVENDMGSNWNYWNRIHLSQFACSATQPQCTFVASLAKRLRSSHIPHAYFQK